MIKKLMLITLLIFVVGCSTYNVNEIELVVNGIEVDSRIIDDYTLFQGKGRSYITFINNEEIIVTNYTYFGYGNKKQPRKIFVTLSEVEFEEFMKIVERCE